MEGGQAMDYKPNLKHPVYEGKSERVAGVDAAMKYLYRKGVAVYAAFGVPDIPFGTMTISDSKTTYPVNWLS